MELDGKTRIFMLEGTAYNPQLSEIFPENKFHNPLLSGCEAQKVIERTDYKGIYYIVERRPNSSKKGLQCGVASEGYAFVHKSSSDRSKISIFEIEIKDSESEIKRYSVEENNKIAQSIEKRANRKGLTIIIDEQKHR